MAEATAPPASEQASVADTPATPAPEVSTPSHGRSRSSGRQILEDAKAELKALPVESSPAEAAPESAATPPEPTPQAPPEKEGTRRQEGQKLREQIRKEVQAEFEANQRAERNRQQTEQQQREFDELVQRADGGDWEAKDRVLQILKGNRGMQAAITQGRTAVLEELGRDITSAVYGLDGLDEDGQQALVKAPSVADFGKVAFEQGRRIERGALESTIATLKAENESLKGRLAGSGPSPTATNGTASVARASDGRFRSMHDAFAAASAELGYRTRQG